MRYLEDVKCPICKQNKIRKADSNNTDKNYFNCDICGRFNITFETNDMLNKRDEPQYSLSSYVREYNEYIYNRGNDNVIDINNDNVDVKMPQIDEKIIKFLKYIDSKQKFDGGAVEIQNPVFLATLFYCKNIEEFRFLVKQLDYIGYCEFEDVELVIDTSKCRLTYAGIKEIYALKDKNSSSNQCFVAMSFSKEHESIFDNGIKPAIESVKDFKAYRVDRDRKHDDKIDNKIISEIRKSRFLIADFTGNKHNVYYEIGYAMGFRISVIFNCEKKYSDYAKQNSILENMIKFDLRQYPCIFFENLEHLKNELRETIEATIL